MENNTWTFFLCAEMKGMEKFIEKFKETHREILKILELSSSILQKKIKNWTVKDAIGHIISWRKEILKIMKGVLREENPEPEWDYFLKTQEDLDKWNEREINTRKDKNPEELKRELEFLLNEWISFLQNINEEMFDKEFQPPWEGKTTIRECIEIEIEHTKGHLKKITEIIKVK